MPENRSSSREGSYGRWVGTTSTAHNRVPSVSRTKPSELISARSSREISNTWCCELVWVRALKLAEVGKETRQPEVGKNDVHQRRQFSGRKLQRTDLDFGARDFVDT
jgi:hypothetical protein